MCVGICLCYSASLCDLTLADNRTRDVDVNLTLAFVVVGACTVAARVCLCLCIMASNRLSSLAALVFLCPVCSFACCDQPQAWLAAPQLLTSFWPASDQLPTSFGSALPAVRRFAGASFRWQF